MFSYNPNTFILVTSDTTFITWTILSSLFIFSCPLFHFKYSSISFKHHVSNARFHVSNFVFHTRYSHLKCEIQMWDFTFLFSYIKCEICHRGLRISNARFHISLFMSQMRDFRYPSSYFKCELSRLGLRISNARFLIPIFVSQVRDLIFEELCRHISLVDNPIHTNSNQQKMRTLYSVPRAIEKVFLRHNKFANILRHGHQSLVGK